MPIIATKSGKGNHHGKILEIRIMGTALAHNRRGSVVGLLSARSLLQNSACCFSVQRKCSRQWYRQRRVIVWCIWAPAAYRRPTELSPRRAQRTRWYYPCKWLWFVIE